MHPGIDKYMMRLRMESKERENQSKPPISSPDAVQTADFVFSQFNPLGRIGDSGPLLLAKRKTNRKSANKKSIGNREKFAGPGGDEKEYNKKTAAQAPVKLKEYGRG